MDGGTLRLLYVVTDLIAPLIVGYYIHQRGLLSGERINQMIKFNVIVIYTLLSLASFWVLPINQELLIVPIYGFLVILLPGAIGYLLYARREPDLLDRGAYIASAMLTNIGTLGGVCAFILYSEQGFACTQIIGTCQNILLVLLIFPLSEHYARRHSKKAGRKTTRLASLRALFLSPNQMGLLGMAAGFLLNVYGIERPAAIGTAFQALVHIGAWIALLPVGYLIDFSAIRRYAPRVRSLTILHFLLTPLLLGLPALALGGNTVLRGTLFIVSFCPTAINAVLAARLYGLTTNLAVASFFITTVLFLALIFPALFFALRFLL